MNAIRFYDYSELAEIFLPSDVRSLLDCLFRNIANNLNFRALRWRLDDNREMLLIKSGGKKCSATYYLKY